MAKRVRRRRSRSGQFTAKRNPSRKRSRRRRTSTAVARHNPPRRRRRRSVAATTHRRRRARRNPDIITAVGGAAFQGAINGAGVVVGETLGRKIRGGVQGMLPADVNVSSGLPGLATSAAVSLAVTAAASMFTPARYRKFGEFVVAGAWAETINQALAQTPVAKYLSAYPSPLRLAGGARVRGAVRAYPQLPARSGVAAYPRMAGVPAVAGL